MYMCIHTHTHKDRYVIVDIWMNMLMKSLFVFHANGTMRCSGYHYESLLGWDMFTHCAFWYKRYVLKPSFLTVASLN